MKLSMYSNSWVLRLVTPLMMMFHQSFFVAAWLSQSSNKPVPTRTMSLFSTPPENSRRSFLHQSIPAAAFLVLPLSAKAVPLLSSQEAEKGLGLPRWQRPKPPGGNVDRPKVDSDFAILLTRASHLETGQLDIGDIEQLERDMYLVRTAELQPYRQSLPPSVYMAQGDLTNPYYFDHYSYVQYEVINRAIQDPETDYEERQPIFPKSGDGAPTFKSRQVHRAPVPIQHLAKLHDDRVGKDILDYLMDHTKGTALAIPMATTASNDSPSHDHQDLECALQQLVKLFLISGFASDGDVARHGDGTKSTFVMTLVNPATIWSGQVFQKEKALLRNDYLLKTARQLALEMGFLVLSSDLKIQGGVEEQSFLSVE